MLWAPVRDLACTAAWRPPRDKGPCATLARAPSRCADAGSGTMSSLGTSLVPLVNKLQDIFGQARAAPRAPRAVCARRKRRERVPRLRGGASRLQLSHRADGRCAAPGRYLHGRPGAAAGGSRGLPEQRQVQRAGGAGASRRAVGASRPFGVLSRACAGWPRLPAPRHRNLHAPAAGAAAGAHAGAAGPAGGVGRVPAPPWRGVHRF